MLAGAGCPSFCGPEHGAWLWRTLREAFPDIYAASLVHHEIHLLANLDAFNKSVDVRHKLSHVVGQFTRRFLLRVGAATVTSVSAAAKYERRRAAAEAVLDDLGYGDVPSMLIEAMRAEARYPSSPASAVEAKNRADAVTWMMQANA